jgi:hypothetical protein
MVRFGTNEAEHKGLVENLSETGLFLTANQVLPPRTKIRIEFTVGETPGVLEGIVQWARQMPASISQVIPSGMGVRLTSAPEAYRKLLSRINRKFPY